MSAIATSAPLAERRRQGRRRLLLASAAVALFFAAAFALWAESRSQLETGVPTSPVSAVSTGGGATWVVTRAGKNSRFWSYVTGDGTWLRVTQSQANGANLGDPQVLDALHGWVVIGKGDAYDSLRGIARTTDGGRTWQTSALPGCSSCQFDSLTFFDTKRGYLAVYADPGRGGTELFWTSDGGATWRLASNSSRAAGAAWLDPQHGIYDHVIGSPGGYVGGDQLFRTSDGGRTWTPFALAGKLSYPGLIGGIWSVDGTLVIPAAPNGPPHPVVYTSSDGGAHWQVHSVPAQAQVSDCCLFPGGALFDAVSRDVWVTVDAGWRHLFETSDAGKSWRVVKLPGAFWNPGGSAGYGMSESPTVEFTSAKVGWAILGNSDLLFRTTDGGRHWTRVSRPASKRHGHR